jgi:hypothetical protein
LVNALVQLELQWLQTGVPDTLTPDVLQVVARIQQARPEALRTVERFKLLFLAAESLAYRLRTFTKTLNNSERRSGTEKRLRHPVV